MLIAELTKRMIEYSNGNLHDIAHFIKVYGYAKTIGACEKLDQETQEILEIAALFHNIEGMDYQILIEADYLVNADESNYSRENIQNMLEKVFRTPTGCALLKAMYLNE